jgi:hypothetical protein
VAALAEPRVDPHRLLVTLPVGNNVVNIAIPNVVTVLVCGEIVSKSCGLGNARRWSLTAARPLPDGGARGPDRETGTAIGGDSDIEEPHAGD